MLLECNNISFKYPDTDKFIFKNLSLKITEPGFNALFGPSGVGKTSFAKIISGDIKNFSGNIKTSGLDRIAYSYNLERLPGWSSIGTHLNKITADKNKAQRDELIKIFGLENCMDHRFSQLSLGQKNRINLIRYLLQDFQMLILDESLANVDEFTRENIILKIKDMFPYTIFLYISHNVVEVSKLCKNIFVLRNTHKTPQLYSVQGQNIQTGKNLDKETFELTMLEVMNAA